MTKNQTKIMTLLSSGEWTYEELEDACLSKQTNEDLDLAAPDVMGFDEALDELEAAGQIRCSEDYIVSRI
jgi:hypothetical protein